MTKKVETKKTDTKKTAAKGETAEMERTDPWARLHLGDWLDRWPDLFARRWPEAFSDMPFVESGFRMEQLVEDDGTMVIRGELPGLDAEENITVTADDDRLTIAATREERSEEEREGRVRSEFHYGTLQRTVALPAGARRDDIVASYEDGILEVRVPVDAERPAATTVPVQRRH